jgi:hypothetical protein
MFRVLLDVQHAVRVSVVDGSTWAFSLPKLYSHALCGPTARICSGQFWVLWVLKKRTKNSVRTEKNTAAWSKREPQVGPKIGPKTGDQKWVPAYYF